MPNPTSFSSIKSRSSPSLDVYPAIRLSQLRRSMFSSPALQILINLLQSVSAHSTGSPGSKLYANLDNSSSVCPGSDDRASSFSNNKPGKSHQSATLPEPKIPDASPLPCTLQSIKVPAALHFCKAKVAFGLYRSWSCIHLHKCN